MADLEEVLSEMDSSDYIHDSIQFIIDKNLRTIPVPSNGSVLGVTGDNNVNRVNFKMERYYDGNDLSTFKIRISYINANGDNNFYDATDMIVEDGNMIFTWLIASDVVAYAGNVSFAVRFFTVDDTDPTKIVKSFNTSIVTANVIQGMYVSDGMSQEDQHDIITQLLSMIEIPEASGGVGQNTEGKTYENITVNYSTSTYYGSNTAEIFNDYENNNAADSYSHAEGKQTKALRVASHAEGEKTLAGGEWSHAEGYETQVSGSASHAEGYQSKASGSYAHAEGYNTEASWSYAHAEGYYSRAGGSASHAEGYQTYASDNNAHAEGDQTAAKGDSAHSEGYKTLARSDYSHAEGDKTTAFGACSHAEGRSSNVLPTTINFGTAAQDVINAWNTTKFNLAHKDNTHVEGRDCLALDIQAHAEGYQTIASGGSSHAEGYQTITSGTAAHAEGYQTNASSSYAHAEGTGTIAASANQHAQGKYNVEDTSDKFAFIIGNGDSNTARSNAFAIDWDGKIYVGDATEGVDVSDLGGSGGVGQNTEGITYEDFELDGLKYDYEGKITAEVFNDYTNNIAAGDCSHAEGTYTAAIGDYSHAEGGETTAKGTGSHSEGLYTIAKGSYSHAEGQNTKANNTASHAEGQNAAASGIASHAEGYETKATGKYAHAEGQNTTASAQNTHAEGQSTEASKSCAHAEGWNTVASAYQAHAEGTSTIAASENQHVQGKFNVEDTTGKYAFIIGNGSSSVRSNAFAIDWDGKIYVDNATEGVNVSAFGNSISSLTTEVSSLSDSVSAINSGMVGKRTDAEGAEVFNDYSNNEATGEYSHASGYRTAASSAYQTVIGQLNNRDTEGKYAFIIGNGYMDQIDTNAYAERRSTGFAIDWDGKIYVNNATEGVDVAALLGRVAELEAKVAALEGSTS